MIIHYKATIRWIFTVAFMIAFLLSTLARLGWANGIPVPPVSHTFIKNDGSIEPLTAPIRRIGNVYLFTNNILNSTLEVECDNIVIDGAGFTIQGNGAGEGITLDGRANVTVKNVNTYSFGVGVYLVRSSNNQIVGNNMTGWCGAYIDSSSNNIIKNNNITGKGSYGIVVTSSSDNTIAKNRIGDFADGLKIDYSSANVFDFNTLTGCSDGFSLFASSGNNISRNQIMYGGTGVHLAHDCERNKVFRNIIVGNGNGVAIEYDAIGNIVFENNLTSNAYGVNIGEKDYLINNIGVPSGNIFYRNNFIDNVQSVYISEKVPQNFWNYGASGNFWSDYNGSTTEVGHFFGRFYVINDENIDYLPLTTPTSIQLIEDPEAVDTLPPVVSIVSPENDSSLTVDVALNFTINEPTSQITYSLDGAENITISGNTTLAMLANSNHNLTVYAWDEAGNIGASKTIIFSVAEPSQSYLTTLVIIASGASLAVVAAGVLVYFKKRKRNNEK